MKKKLLFLQLPLLDNDTSAPRENFPFAAVWLAHVLAQHPEGAFWEVIPAPPEWDELDNRSLIEQIRRHGADAAAFTLCLWNVERSLRIVSGLKAVAPHIYCMAGGPEIAEDHPFLLDQPAFDALVVGEGETVFPELLRGVRTGTFARFDNLLLAAPGGWTKGSRPPPPVDLRSVQVPAERLSECLRKRPAVYLETARGCPLSCTYCRYHHLQKSVRTLPAAEVAARVLEFRAAGAREIRFVDPTFNARADFTELLRLLAGLNADGRLSFFAELRADTLTPEQAALLAQARFAEVEVGVQSTDPAVLRLIRRPAPLERIERGIRLLTDAGVRVTVDLMYGLPEQRKEDLVRGIAWARGLGRGVTVQCMQTLLLPGTDLREQAAQYGMTALALPPYGVVSTSALSEADMADIERTLHASPDLPADPATPRFVGFRLHGLFREQCAVELDEAARPGFRLPGRCNRRALILRGGDLPRRRAALCRLIEQAVSEEPDSLWQFVLCAESEVPLGVLKALLAAIRRLPPHLLDRYASAELFGLRTSRRLFIRLRPGRHYDPEWRAAAEALLAAHFL